ncbi:RloB family protein [Actinomadura algeriensis]|uniref:RloB domain-containing protein n=1 Tax=Actinomadura algeriensis TaxID=1679523 RepID=A0ABR9JK15_9ACTN|nr:RloB family protein [Actinomadura algeriensis]MBE1530887.1 hypothetical protein [Actinomadura algeriensis]
MCEGKTEKLYFTGMRSRHGPQLAVDAPDGDHLWLIGEAGRRRTAEYDEVWCVLDTELNKDLVRKLIAEAEKSKVNLALSSPCFEFWLILHIEDYARPFQTAEEAKRKLARLSSNWSEAKTNFRDFKDGVEDACKRARKLQPGADGLPCNPSTSVWQLVEKIREPSAD